MTLLFQPNARIAVVGATGAVGREALALLAEVGHPLASVVGVASLRSTGELVPYGAETLTVTSPSIAELAALDLVVLCTDAPTSRRLAPEIVGAGGRVVDNSSAFREDPRVPLVVPELAPPPRGARLVANPNCSTILLVTALDPLRRAFGVEHLVVSTYQAVSGAGAQGLVELEDATRAALAHAPFQPTVFPESCAFNVFPHESPIDEATGANTEELKLVRETRRLWGMPELGVVATCVRVPVFRAHAESVVLTLGRAASVVEVCRALAGAPGVELVDEPATGTFPSSLRAAGRNEVLVGRVRPAGDEACDAAGRTRRFALWLAGDQLRKGAAWNALQIGAALLRPESPDPA